MSENVQEPPATQGPLARLLGVIVSPGETFQDIDRRPGWIFPLAAYLVVFTVAFYAYGMKTDWVATVGNQLESYFAFLPDEALDTAIQEGVKPFQDMTQTEQTIYHWVNGIPYMVPIYHLSTIIYATLFVMMGSLETLKLGRAYLFFGLGLALIIPYGVIAFIAQATFADSPQNALILTGLGAVGFIGAYFWVLNLASARDEAFSKVLSVVTHSLAVMMIWSIAVLTVSMISQEAIETPIQTLVKANLGAVLKLDGVLGVLSSWIDVFYIWSTVVLAIGFRVITRLSMGVSASIAFLPYVVMMLVHVAFVAVFG